MIELHLEHTIIAFDGRVIETFPQGQAASRYHVANVKTADIKSDRKGRQSLQIFMKGGRRLCYSTTIARGRPAGTNAHRRNTESKARPVESIAQHGPGYPC